MRYNPMCKLFSGGCTHEMNEAGNSCEEQYCPLLSEMGLERWFLPEDRVDRPVPKQLVVTIDSEIFEGAVVLKRKEECDGR